MATRPVFYSSRKIQAKTYDDVAFRFLSADEHQDHSTLAEFRKRHLTALAGLFMQALQLCAKAGLVKLGHVAIDGTKIKANATLTIQVADRWHLLHNLSEALVSALVPCHRLLTEIARSVAKKPEAPAAPTALPPPACASSIERQGASQQKRERRMARYQ